MNFLIAAAYVVLGGLTAFLLGLLFLNREKENVEINDAMLGPEELEKHAIEVARKHTVGRRTRRSRWLVPRVNDNFRYISSVHKALNEDTGNMFATVPAAEWLLDNYYIVEEQVKDICRNLSKGYYAQLPVLKTGYMKGYPRVYAIALELVSHSDGMVDEKSLVSFIEAYQSQTLLSIGELWAIAIMLRIALIENIRNICEKIMESQLQWHAAEKLADSIETESSGAQDRLLKLLKECVKGNPAISPSFVQHLLEKLRKQGKKTLPVVKAIDTFLAEQNTATDALVSLEHQLQAFRQVSIGNSITSLRLVSSMDWNDIFELLSRVEHILRQDAAGIYTRMDFESRDYYRHEVEKLAKRYKTSEVNIARKAIECAAEAEGGSEDEEVRAHIGYYLIGKGRKCYREKLGQRRAWYRILGENVKEHPDELYLGLIAFVTLAVTAGLLLYAVARESRFSAALTLLTLLVVLVPAADLAVTFVNCIVSHLYKPAILPKMKLEGGIPEEYATMVIIPTLLPNEKRVGELLQQLEVYYLANRENNLYFSLVGDFKDAPAQEAPEDGKIINAAMQGVHALNRKYAPPEKPVFFYFHRYRQHNAGQEKWMGWERKRGAIVEFNDLLLGKDDTSYSVMSSERTAIPKIKYIITLDADTNLPMGAAKRLVGTMAHPLNRAVPDREKGIITEGYGLLQPRIGVSILSANATLFSRIFAGQGGIDPYTTAVSDVYQDLFGEGIFTGKGIYELEIFQKILKEAIPENAVLSHDLIEGCYVRAGLVTDVELVDGYPARYNAYAMRLHRWVRGDWQLLPWLGVRVRNSAGQWVRNPLSAISRWKIIDNLRRSLLSPSLLLLILLGLGALPGNSFLWLGLAIVTGASPVLVHMVNTLLSDPNGSCRVKRNATVICGYKAVLYQCLLLFAFIPYQAYLMADAILRTLARVFITHRNMLEWVTAADMEANLKNDLMSFWRRMWISLPAGLLAVFMSAAGAPGTLFLTIPILLVWGGAPSVAHRISMPHKLKQEPLAEEDRLQLRKIARKTWRFYEDFSGAEDNYLPPDNYQENPPRGIAHRTSPTNIGFLLLAVVSARDLGFIGTAEMTGWLARTIETIEKMEKWKGHLYNWYDTRTLHMLRPWYVSTVDSGNFIGYLMVVEYAVREYAEKPQVDLPVARGLKELLELCNEELEGGTEAISTYGLEQAIAEKKLEEDGWREILEEIRHSLAKTGRSQDMEKGFWGKKLLSTLDALESELNRDRAELAGSMEQLADRIRALIDGMEFAPLFDSKRQLFSIGYNVEDGVKSKSYYDLLASEARQASYIAVARGEVEQSHWFRLGRKLTVVDGYKGLVSWTGTMFEYLMPLLVMRNYENTLLDETYSFVVRNQKRYGKKRNIPWGVSESGYNAFDLNLNYQYKAFGLPELGLKRGLSNDIVVAPYAALLALGIDPQGVVRNIGRLAAEGVEGSYGLYEAVDYTPSRLARDNRSSIVRSFMAHHQGMSLAAVNNYLNGNILQQRFHANPVIKSAELLLQERIPSRVSYTKEYREEFIPLKKSLQEDGEVVRTFGIPARELPAVHMLSNGSYTVMLTNGGTGYSRNSGIAVNRWREDLRGPGSGIFIYIQNMNANNVWSTAFEPFRVVPEAYKVVFSPDKAEFMRKDGNIETHTEIIVSAEDNAEIRRVSLTNRSGHPRVLEVTSYFEVVLAYPEEDQAHPAFSNLFIRTEFVAEHSCLLASRRPRNEKKAPLWAFHSIAVEGETVGELQYETDRFKFIGRNRSPEEPLAMDVDQPLSNTAGAVLEPVMSLRRRVAIEPGQTVRITYVTGVADTRKAAVELAEKYTEAKGIERAFELAWTRSQIEARYLDFKADEVEQYLNLIPAILFPGPLRRRWADAVAGNAKGQPDLWPFGISGDIPIVLLHISSKEEMEMVFWSLKAHEYWRMKGLTIDLVLLLEDENGYMQPLLDAVRDAVSASHARELQGRHGGVFIQDAGAMRGEDKDLLYTAARVAIKESVEAVMEGLTDEGEKEFVKWITCSLEGGKPSTLRRRNTMNQSGDGAEMEFFNGTGGFAKAGKEYVVTLQADRYTPAPWSNVIANRQFGFIVTESGGGYTWAENSRENKLTPWYNDPVSDFPGEVLYVRDEEKGNFWSITPMPVRDGQEYTVRHGQGYSCFEHAAYGMEQRLTVFAALEDPVKICLVTLENKSGAGRELSLTYYLRPVLGVSEKSTAQYIVTEMEREAGALLVRNVFSCDFKGRVVFVAATEKDCCYTGNRNEFIGINGSILAPQAMNRDSLSGAVGAGFDPCAAIQVKLQLGRDEKKEVVFLLGQGKNRTEALQLAEKFRDPGKARSELDKVMEYWRDRLGGIQVSTPDRSMNILLNTWLLYQVIACRLWARSAFYQSGGAYGFRDQLQDVMAAAYTCPELTRSQILLHASRQFVEGDVQHWWHAEAGKGIRTRYSDDLLWLAYVTADYIRCSGDSAILDEEVGYLEEPPLGEEEDERYNIPGIAGERTNLYEHCVRAIENSMGTGPHGIPLMGSGDWNDGMNTVGNKGKGESIWLGWFLTMVLKSFIPLCLAREDGERARRYADTADRIRDSIEKEAWDGSWYRRAYFDDGTPLGSIQNTECKIDSISQSWAAISGEAKQSRVEEAMGAVEKYLVDREEGIIKLLTPPFDTGDLHPGYIKGYVPGVRENGGQYTHAAAWVSLAFARMGKGDKAWEMFHLINPVNHARTPIEYARYKVEPYVMAADVYAIHPHTGRGGWTWYTGAAGWMYRVGMEHILGLKKVGSRLEIAPCIPGNWSEYRMEYRCGASVYDIHIANPEGVNTGVKSIKLDEKPVENGSIQLADDGKDHRVEVVMG